MDDDGGGRGVGVGGERNKELGVVLGGVGKEGGTAD